MIAGNHAHVTVASEEQGHLQDIVCDRHDDTYENFPAPCATEYDETYEFDSDEHGQCVELCFATDMARIVLAEQQPQTLSAGQMTNMRVYATAEYKTAAVVKKDDPPTKADAQANSAKKTMALHAEFEISHGSKCFNAQDMNNATHIMTPKFVSKWKFVKNETGEMERTIRLSRAFRGFMDAEASDVETFAGAARRAS
eukprot:9503839-Pyramimonas_sp.AAC.3